MHERNADQLHRLAPGDGLWPSSGPGLPQALISPPALVLRGWYLGELSPFGVTVSPLWSAALIPLQDI